MTFGRGALLVGVAAASLAAWEGAPTGWQVTRSAAISKVSDGSPTGCKMSAQGNALGYGRKTGKKALKGRNPFSGDGLSPFQGGRATFDREPRALPWAGLFQPFGLRTSPSPVSLTHSLPEASSFETSDPKLTRFEFVQPHMGTRFRIVLYAADEATAKKAADAAFARVAQLDQIMSDYKEDSELMRLCRQAGGEPVKVSVELFDILCKSQELARRTRGAFDVTIGPVVQLWRRARRQRQLPDAKRLAAAGELVGYQKLMLDEKSRTVRLVKPGMLLDLGGIAKGYAVDEAQKVLKQHGVRSTLVAGGGDIAVSEPPPRIEGWPIGIAPLDDSNKPPTRTLFLRNAAVSTSGDAEQHVEIDGKRYSHIVDPKTGLGLTGRGSVTVVAPTCTQSDGLATAVSVLGPEKGLELIEATDHAAVLITLAAEQGARTFRSKRWNDGGRAQKE